MKNVIFNKKHRDYIINMSFYYQADQTIHSLSRAFHADTINLKEMKNICKRIYDLAKDIKKSQNEVDTRDDIETDILPYQQRDIRHTKNKDANNPDKKKTLCIDDKNVRMLRTDEDDMVAIDLESGLAYKLHDSEPDFTKAVGVFSNNSYMPYM